MPGAFAGFEDVEELGCERILTSGQKGTAEEGISLLKELVACAREVIIMPGCGVNAGNIEKIAKETGACEFHLSAREGVESAMIIVIRPFLWAAPYG